MSRKTPAARGRKPAPRIPDAAARLRAAAELLESREALYTEEGRRQLLEPVLGALHELERDEVTRHRVSLEAFQTCRAPWLRAWQRARVAMEDQLREAWEGLPTHDADESETAYRLRLLVDALEFWESPEVVLERCRIVGQAPEPVWGDSPHFADGQAREALLTWGQMSQAEFLAAWPALDSGLVERAAAIVGQNLEKLTPAKKKRLHATAVRVFRNTRM